VADACRFLGYTTSAEKEELVNACDLMCVPSRNEPFKVVVLVAWDACKPVVDTEAISIIKNSEDGLLAYIEPQSLAWCINRLLADPEKMQRLAEAGHARIEAEFSWDRIARRTEDVYKEVLQGLQASGRLKRSIRSENRLDHVAGVDNNLEKDLRLVLRSFAPQWIV